MSAEISNYLQFVRLNDYQLPSFLRLTVSDGDNYGHAVISDQVVLEKELAEGSLVRIERYVCKTLKGGIKVIVIGKLHIEEQLNLEKIGRPIWVQEGGTTRALAASSLEKKQQPQQQLHQHHNQRHLTTPRKEQEKKEKDPLDGAQLGGVACSGPSSQPEPVMHQMVPSRKLRKIGPEGRKEKNPATNRADESDLSPMKALTRISSRPIQVDEAPFHQGIRFISPYRRRWEIKGRCSFKGELRQFERRKGNGKGTIFSFQLTDNTGSIDITAFSQVAQTFFEQVRVDHVYLVSNGHLRAAHPKFNRSTSFYEMHLNENSVVREVVDDGSVLRPHPKFVKIRDLLRTRSSSLVDTLGVVEDVSEVAQVFLRSSGQEILKRTVTILDDSNASVSLILWGERVNFLKNGDGNSGKILMVQGARTGYYEGIILKVGRRTILTVNPKMDEADTLRTWYFQKTGRLGRPQFKSSILQLARLENPLNKDRITLVVGKSKVAQASFPLTEENSSNKTNGLSFTMRGMLAEFRQEINMAYPSDPFTKKKVEEVAPGIWYSTSSKKNFTDDEVKWRYALWTRVVDETGDCWMCAFDEPAQVFLQHAAGEMKKLKAKDTKRWQQILQDACFEPIIIEVIGKQKTFRGETKLHYIINQVEFINFAEEGRKVFHDIKNYANSLQTTV